MSPRDTRTGAILEQMILPALHHGGYVARRQVNVGKRLGGGSHVADVLAERRGEKVLVSLKWQQVSGTAEQKVPFEVICLAEALEGEPTAKAYLVLGGEGWTLREFYISGGLEKHLKKADRVRIVTLESFVAKANQGAL